MLVDELQRRAYLDAMGVDSYMPRFVLPAAPPSLLCARPLTAPQTGTEAAKAVPARAPDQLAALRSSAPEPAPAAATTASAAQQGSRHLRALLDMPLVTECVEPSVAKAAVANGSAAGPVRFSLVVMSVSQGILVLDDAGTDAEADAHTALLHNLLFALGVDTANSSRELFAWPKTSSARLESGAAAASQSLCAFLHRLVEHSGARALLLMGSSAAAYATPGVSEQGQARYPWARFAVPVFTVSSALQALREPGQKAPLWRELTALRRMLGADPV